MLLTAEELRTYVETRDSDKMITARLEAIESKIREYTNNHFQQVNIRTKAAVCGGVLASNGELPPFKAGDTVEVSQSRYNDGLYQITDIAKGVITLNRPLDDEPVVTCTKVAYPKDVIIGCIELYRWEIENRRKTGISSETISRHSVTYFNQDGENTKIGYPNSLIGFLRPYIKARF